ncbi:hypothetical protein [Ruegeria sp. HKCCD7221]|uniref:hypothetical protein n=1 Tax=Ruegeria sp. HKCCD7221 TaxID=2683009 RepID=UPI001487B500|nr:hypothetical protein [Ruegeria sp. HKCCD7221]
MKSLTDFIAAQYAEWLALRAVENAYRSPALEWEMFTAFAGMAGGVLLIIIGGFLAIAAIWLGGLAIAVVIKTAWDICFHGGLYWLGRGFGSLRRAFTN